MTTVCSRQRILPRRSREIAHQAGLFAIDGLDGKSGDT
jgi:hypothetical protein